MKIFLTILFLFFVSSPTLAQAESQPASRPESRPAALKATKTELFQRLQSNIREHHERVLGISYGDRPLLPIRFEIPGDFGAERKIKYRGQYDEAQNFIILNPLYLDASIGSLLRDFARGKAPASRPTDHPDTADLHEVISHELGHHFVDILIETEIKDSWLQAHIRAGKNLGDDDVGVFVIREGIGTYFERVFTRRAPEFCESDVLTTITADEMHNPLVHEWVSYKGGYAVVKPIIDRYGLEGIRYLVRTPLVVCFPGIEELPVYRETALKTLAEQTKKK